jgi:hypothetical protein
VDLLYLAKFSPRWDSLYSIIIDIKSDNPIIIIDYIAAMILEISHLSNAEEHYSLYAKYHQDPIYGPLSSTKSDSTQHVPVNTKPHISLGVWNARYYNYLQNWMRMFQEKQINWVSICLILTSWPPQEGFAPFLDGRDPRDLNISTISISYISVTKELIDYIHKRPGLKLYAWTLNDAAGIRHALELGLDAVLTNDPTLCWDIATAVEK